MATCMAGAVGFSTTHHGWAVGIEASRRSRSAGFIEAIIRTPHAPAGRLALPFPTPVNTGAEDGCPDHLLVRIRARTRIQAAESALIVT